MAPNRARVTAYLDKDMADRIAAAAQQRGQSLSVWIERAAIYAMKPEGARAISAMFDQQPAQEA